MSVFRTVLPDIDFPKDINPMHKLLCMGSCFAENIGNRLKDAKFQVNINPFGILFNPISIADSLDFLLQKKYFETVDIFEHEGIWQSFMHHSRFGALDADIALANINEALRIARADLQSADWLIVTLGTANVFVDKQTDKVVANCHKLPANRFERKQLQLPEIEQSLHATFERLQTQYPNLKILLTVSPIRHIKDGLIENQRSKARLILAAESLTNTMANIFYFPAYELLMDDLRDYRFYEKDMIHPNEQAVDYIWDYFNNNLFSETTKTLLSEIEGLRSAATHRPFQVDSAAYQHFAKATLDKINVLCARFSHLDFTYEIGILAARLKA